MLLRRRIQRLLMHPPLFLSPSISLTLTWADALSHCADWIPAYIQQQKPCVLLVYLISPFLIPSFQSPFSDWRFRPRWLQRNGLYHRAWVALDGPAFSKTMFKEPQRLTGRCLEARFVPFTYAHFQNFGGGGVSVDEAFWSYASGLLMLREFYENAHAEARIWKVLL